MKKTHTFIAATMLMELFAAILIPATAPALAAAPVKNEVVWSQDFKNVSDFQQLINNQG